MKNERMQTAIRVTGALALLVAMALGWLIWAYVSTKPADDAPQGAISASVLTPTTLATAEDYEPGMDKFFTVYDGTLFDTKGGDVSLVEFRGKPLVLFFWSSWCGDCKDLFNGWLDDAAAEVEKCGGRLLLVCREGARGENAISATSFLEERGVTRETLMDAGSELFKSMGFSGVPTLAFLSPKGELMCAMTDMPDINELGEYIRYASGEAAKQTEEFISGFLTGDSGGVSSAFYIDEQGHVVARDGTLSETQGIIMQHALSMDNKALFDKAYSFVASDMTKGGLCAWRVENGKAANINATLDDLRVVDALMGAEERWGGYKRDIATRERALYRGVVADAIPRDYVNFATGARANTTTLCYLDIAVLDRLASYNKRWWEVANKARLIVENGLISDEFPLYYPRYDPKTGGYSGSLLQMNEAMVTVFNASKAGIVREETLDYLEELLRAGPVYASYLTTGQIAAGFEYESTATYALMVLIGAQSGRDELKRLALNRMERERYMAKPLIGGYGREAGVMHYTFDTVTAMLAWNRL